MQQRMTPVPRIETGITPAAAGSVTSYFMSDEELEEVRRRYPASPGKAKKQTAVHLQPKEERTYMGKFSLTEKEYEAELAAGKTKEQIAKEQGVTVGAINYHLHNWGEAAVKASKEEAELMREKNAIKDASDPEKEKLRQEVAAWKQAASEVREELEKANDERDQYKSLAETASEEATGWQGQATALQQRIGELEVEQANSVEQPIQQHVTLDEKGFHFINPQPENEIDRIDRMIVDLQHARQTIAFVNEWARIQN